MLPTEASPTTRKNKQALPLNNGDRMSRHEFELRYAAMPSVKKAELIEGVVYMPSPVRYKSHGEPHGHVLTWLGVYAAFTPYVAVADNATVRLDLENEPQPDVCLRIEETAGGLSSISEDDYIEGPPELIVEIAASSAAYDLHDKLRAYKRNGILEYLVWRVENEAFDWFVLVEGNYKALQMNEQGIIASPTFAGLTLNVPALLSSDLAKVIDDVQANIKTKKHEGFVERLIRQAE